MVKQRSRLYIKVLLSPRTYWRQPLREPDNQLDDHQSRNSPRPRSPCVSTGALGRLAFAFQPSIVAQRADKTPWRAFLMASNNGFSDPVKFAEQLFSVKLWDAQRAILRVIAAERRVAVKACHASGKTFAAAICYRQCKH